MHGLRALTLRESEDCGNAPIVIRRISVALAPPGDRLWDAVLPSPAYSLREINDDGVVVLYAAYAKTK